MPLLNLDKADPVEVFVQFELSYLLRVEHLHVVDDENEAVSVDVQHLPDFPLEVADLPVLVQLEPVLLLGAHPADDQGVRLMHDHLQVVAVLDVLQVIRNALVVLQLTLVQHQQDLVLVYLQLLLDLQLQQLDGVRLHDVEGELAAVLRVYHLDLHVVGDEVVQQEAVVGFSADVQELGGVQKRNVADGGYFNWL